jgi:hypothetical protein
MADNELEDPIKAAAEAASVPEEGENSPQVEGSQEIPPDIGIDALKIQLQNEQAARLEAERRANVAQQYAGRAHVEVQDSNLQLVVSAIDTIKRDNLMNRRAYAEALASQDFDRAAEINEVIVINASKLRQLEDGKTVLEQRAAEARQPQQQQQQPAQGGDPVEAVASQLSPRSAAWIRAHPEAVKNQKTYTKMIGLHNVAVADGLVADSDEYFEYIETQLGYRKPARQQDVDQDDDPQAQAAKPMQRRVAPPSAPPSRGGSSNRITLSAAQREAASISGLTEEEYARNLQNEKKRRVN